MVGSDIIILTLFGSVIIGFWGTYPLSHVRRRLIAIHGKYADDKHCYNYPDDIGCVVHKVETNQCGKNDEENHVYSIHSTRI